MSTSPSTPSAVLSTHSEAPPATHLITVDVAPGQNLSVRYDYEGETVVMTSRLSCENAERAAELAIKTLLKRAGG